jgi:hypothetical protein
MNGDGKRLRHKAKAQAQNLLAFASSLCFLHFRLGENS